MNLKQILTIIMRKKGKVSFLSQLDNDSSVLDVGCGLNSPFNFKKILPKAKYTGIDIVEYNKSEHVFCDKYIYASPRNFSEEILKLKNIFDAVVCSHNIEHCDDREGTLTAMLDSLKIGGLIYLSFPCEKSVNFPKREGTLNYFDDNTHQDMPPKFQVLIDELKKNNFEIIFSTQHNKPIFLWLIGLITEPYSKYKKKVLKGTWEYYGFESIIWAQKIK